MIDEKIELDPCPFCGGDADWIDMGEETWVHCIDCGVGYGGTIPIERWNRRTPPHPDTAADAGEELGSELIAWAADEKWVVREGEGGGRYCIFDCLYHPEDGHGSHCPHLRARALKAGE